MKLVPRSHLERETGPQIAKNLCRAQIKGLVSVDSNTSMWTALLLKYVNTSPQRLELADLRVSHFAFLLCMYRPGTENVETNVREKWGDFRPVGRQIGHTLF